MQCVVLIPLNSGLAFIHGLTCSRPENPGLNPFEFRAGVHSKRLMMAGAVWGLNPFEFRAGVHSEWLRMGATLKGS